MSASGDYNIKCDDICQKLFSYAVSLITASDKYSGIEKFLNLVMTA